MTVKLKNEIIPDDLNLHSKCPFRSNGHFQVNFYPILMAIIAFCAKSVNNPKTPLIPRPIMHGRKKKRFLRTKSVKNISTYDFAIFLVCSACYAKNPFFVLKADQIF